MRTVRTAGRGFDSRQRSRSPGPLWVRSVCVHYWEGDSGGPGHRLSTGAGRHCGAGKLLYRRCERRHHGPAGGEDIDRGVHQAVRGTEPDQFPGGEGPGRTGGGAPIPAGSAWNRPQPGSGGFRPPAVGRAAQGGHGPGPGRRGHGGRGQ